MTYKDCWQPLTKLYPESEAKAIARMVLQVRFHMTLADIVAGGVEQLAGMELAQLQQLRQRLVQGEPVQYVLGVADFGPRTFFVAPGVLIPRPETYELCQWVLDGLPAAARSLTAPSVLDIGTGSGCIACTLAAEMPQAAVTAWDISEDALRIARENARRTRVNVSFRQVDVLSPLSALHSLPWDLIVSNPPYICGNEAADMDSWVLDYEPEEALFVPDDDPLLFYRHISNYAQSALAEGGRLFFEVNPLYEEHVEDILLGLGFDDVRVKDDQFGKPRFIRATWH